MSESSKQLGSQQVQRRTWDVDEYQKKADEKAAQREEEVGFACMFGFAVLTRWCPFSQTKTTECKRKIYMHYFSFANENTGHIRRELS